MMSFAIIAIIVIIIVALVGTIAVTGKSDENYRQSHKSNTFRLTAIYAVVILVSLAILGWYISTL